MKVNVDRYAVEAKAAANWHASPAVRAEFASQAAYTAYELATAQGNARLFSPRAQQAPAVPATTAEPINTQPKQVATASSFKSRSVRFHAEAEKLWASSADIRSKFVEKELFISEALRKGGLSEGLASIQKGMVQHGHV